MDKQQKIRKALCEYIKESGVTQLHICKKTGIKPDVLSRFKNSIINELWEEDLIKLEEYINTHI